MAGDLFLKEQTVVVVQNDDGGSLTNGSAVLIGSAIDMRAGGTTNLIQNLRALAELKAQWGTVTGIAAGTVLAELYLIPALDGTNYIDIDGSSGAAYLPYTYKVGSFISPKALSASTNYRFACRAFDLFPALWKAYLKNTSGQTISANWGFRLGAARGQYS
jgi:hypothetical protein